MKKIYLTILLCCVYSASSIAQPTNCDEPDVLLSDDIESYAEGDVTLQSPDWDVWPGATLGGVVSSEEAFNSTNSIKIGGGASGQDVLLLLGDKTSGHYILSWQMLVPAEKSAYFNMQHQAPTSSAGFWAFDVYFENGVGRLETYDGNADVAFSHPVDTWFLVYLLIDIDNDVARLVVNQRTVDAWTFSTGSVTSNQMNSINFYPADANYHFYVDNVEFLEIPAAEPGQYCYTAQAIEAAGVFQVPDLACYGAGYDQDSDGLGNKGYWFSYTPTEDGIISVASCGGGVDTRGWIFSGECLDLKTVGVNDDQCEITTGGSSWASYREAVVKAGTTYYILWDDIWETTGFPFELSFSNEAPSPGNFCHSATPIEPGVYDVLEFTGNAAVAGPNINNTSSSTTAYSKSQWYAFTPATDGLMSISSCELAASDTYFFVYTGNCDYFEGLTLVALNDDGCEEGQFTSSLDSIEVSGGTTYYIEWIDRFSDDIFQWELVFESTVGIDDLPELAADIRCFPNPASEQLTIQYFLEQSSEQLQLRLVNVLGQQMLVQSLPLADRNQIDLDVRALPAGLYQVILSDGKSQTSRKVMIQH